MVGHINVWKATWRLLHGVDHLRRSNACSENFSMVAQQILPTTGGSYTDFAISKDLLSSGAMIFLRKIGPLERRVDYLASS